MVIIAVGLTIVALILSLPVAVLTVEVFSASLLRNSPHRSVVEKFARPSVTVIVPAHNEGEALLPTLGDVRNQLRSNDRLLVVADNCTDDTAKLAHSAGAEVLVRNEPGKLGKGYALDFAIRNLEANPPEIVIIIDADCRLDGDIIDTLAINCRDSNRPIQALYKMRKQERDPKVQSVAHLAWLIKNYVRPMGLAKLGLPCQLMGTGMGFPWELVKTVNLATNSLVEDLKLGLDLAARGKAPMFCTMTSVQSVFAASETGRMTQRQRWETGSLHSIIELPFYIRNALETGNLDLLILALDAAVPPLVLLTALLFGFVLFSVFTAMSGFSTLPLSFSLIALIILLLDLVVAWAIYGKEVLPPRDFKYITLFILEKLRVHRRVRGLQWRRTDRT